MFDNPLSVYEHYERCEPFVKDEKALWLIPSLTGLDTPQLNIEITQNSGKTKKPTNF